LNTLGKSLLCTVIGLSLSCSRASAAKPDRTDPIAPRQSETLDSWVEDRDRLMPGESRWHDPRQFAEPGMDDDRRDPSTEPRGEEAPEPDPCDADLEHLGRTPVLPLASVTGPLRVPGEFEPQEALLVTPGLLAKEHPDVLAALVRAVRDRVDLVGVVADKSEQSAVRKALRNHHLPPDAIQLLRVPHNTMWIRDYGPIFVRLGDETRVAIDGEYPDAGRGDDDLLPHAMADFFRVELHKAPMVLEGGNFLTNGQGLCILTTACLERNFADPDAEGLVDEVFRECFGASQTVMLEPLFGESTGHVDMFATFTAADTVVVGQYDEAADAENAHLLHRNAAMLAGLATPAGPLRVVRIPMPPSEDGCRRTFTNVVYANGVLLVPTYQGVDRGLQARAMRVYRSLLPGWKIVPIDSSQIIDNGGALHCITANVPKGKSVVAAPRGTVRRGPPGAHPAHRQGYRRPVRPATSPTAADWHQTCSHFSMSDPPVAGVDWLSVDGASGGVGDEGHFASPLWVGAGPAGHGPRLVVSYRPGRRLPLAPQLPGRQPAPLRTAN